MLNGKLHVLPVQNYHKLFHCEHQNYFDIQAKDYESNMM